MVEIKSNSLSSNSFEELISKSYEHLKSSAELIIDLRKINYIDLGALTYLLAFTCALRIDRIPSIELKQQIKIGLPNNQKALSFILKSGLFSFSSLHSVFVNEQEYQTMEQSIEGAIYPYTPFKRIVEPSKNYRSEEQFEMECRSFIHYIQTTFKGTLTEYLGFSDEAADNFWLPNIELISNIYNHSESFGFGAIQASPKGITICYADIGVGVKKTLEPFKEKIMMLHSNLKTWNDGSAIIGAFTQGLSCKPGRNCGQGLALLKKYVLGNNGTIEFRSGCAKVLFQPNKGAIGQFVDFLPGVQIVIRIPNKK